MVSQTLLEANLAWIRTLCDDSNSSEGSSESVVSMRSSNLSELRAQADCVALWQRLHHPQQQDQAILHGDLRRQKLFTLLELARVQALGGQAFPGVARNLCEYYVKTAPEISGWESLRALAFIRLAQNARAPMMINLSDSWQIKWDAHFCELSSLWETLAGLLHNQDAFAGKVLLFLATFPESLASKLPIDLAENDATNEITLLQDSDVFDASEPADFPSDTLSPAEDIGMNSVQDPDVIEQKNAAASSYNVYTRIFDRVIDANALLNFEQRTAYQNQLQQEMSPYRQIISRLARRMQRQILAWQQRAWLFEREEGVLDPRRLAGLVANPCNHRLFMDETENPFPATVVSLLLDNSASLTGQAPLIAALTTGILAEVLERCGVKVEILGFTTCDWQGGQSKQHWIQSGATAQPGRLNDLMHIIYKGADTPWHRAKENIGILLHSELRKENIDGEALLWAWQRLLARPEPRRILLVVCDGSPHDETTIAANGREYLTRHLREVIQTIESSSVQLGAVGIGQSAGRYYQRAVALRRLDQLGECLMDQLLGLLAPTA